MTRFLWSSVIFILIGCTKSGDDHDEISDKDFVLLASMTNSAAVKIGSLAVTNAASTGVRNFSQTITGYHAAAQDQLNTLAMELNLYAPDSLDAKHINIKNQLADLSGRRFDSAYVHNLVEDYETAIGLFLEEAMAGEDQTLRNYAESVLPNLQMFLQHADSLASQY